MNSLESKAAGVPQDRHSSSLEEKTADNGKYPTVIAGNAGQGAA